VLRLRASPYIGDAVKETCSSPFLDTDSAYKHRKILNGEGAILSNVQTYRTQLSSAISISSIIQGRSFQAVSRDSLPGPGCCKIHPSFSSPTIPHNAIHRIERYCRRLHLPILLSGMIFFYLIGHGMRVFELLVIHRCNITVTRRYMRSTCELQFFLQDGSSKNLARYSLHGFGSSKEWAHVRRYSLQRRGHGEDPQSAIDTSQPSLSSQ